MNTGYLITHDRAALRNWRARHGGGGQDPSQFTQTVGRLTAKFPGKVKTH